MAKSKRLTRREKIAIDGFAYIGILSDMLKEIADDDVVVIEDGVSSNGFHVMTSRAGIDTTKHVVFSGKYFKKAIIGFGCIIDDVM